jgi:hypothetical protein
MNRREFCAEESCVLGIPVFEKLLMHYGAGKITAAIALAGGVFAAGTIALAIGIQSWKRFFKAFSVLLFLSCAAYLIAHFFHKRINAIRVFRRRTWTPTKTNHGHPSMDLENVNVNESGHPSHHKLEPNPENRTWTPIMISHHKPGHPPQTWTPTTNLDTHHKPGHPQ